MPWRILIRCVQRVLWKKQIGLNLFRERKYNTTTKKIEFLFVNQYKFANNSDENCQRISPIDFLRFFLLLLVVGLHQFRRLRQYYIFCVLIKIPFLILFVFFNSTFVRHSQFRSLCIVSTLKRLCCPCWQSPVLYSIHIELYTFRFDSVSGVCFVITL